MTGRILLIEDDEDLAIISAAALIEAGYDVDVVSTVDAAVARCDERTPDLALIDLQLPLKSGWDFIEQVRTSGRWPQMRLAVHTVHVDERETSEGVARLGLDVIGKGDPTVLVDAVRRLTS